MADFFGGDDPCWRPSWPYGAEQEWRMRVAKFGDGYEQRILDGINALDLSFDLSFDTRPKAILLDMDAYLTSLKGSSFPYTDPATGLTFYVFCDKWSIQWEMRRRKDPVTLEYEDYGTLNAKFVKANGVGIAPIT